MNPTSTTRRHFLAAAGLASAGLASAGLASAGLASAGDPPLAPPDRQPSDLALPDPPAKKLGWAVVGLGKLALEEVMPAFRECRRSRPTALVSGHPDTARRVADAYGIDRKHLYDYDSFDELADDPAVDVVYVVLPNSMHAEYTVRGLKAGKHVLCEKPMAVSVAECERMIAAGKQAGRLLMVAYRLRYEPFNATAIDLCRKGEVGAIKSVTASNCQDVAAPNIRLSRALGGGPVGDVGIYCLNAARYLTGEEPVEVTAVAHRPADDPRFREVPETVAFALRFPSGAVANCDCSFGTAESRRFRVQGTEGVLDMERAFGYRGQRLVLDRGGRSAEVKLDPVNHFAAEMDHFAECVRAGKAPRTPGGEGLADVRVIAAIEKAASSGRVEKVGG